MMSNERITIEKDGTIVIDCKPDYCLCPVCQEIDRQRAEEQRTK